MFQILKSSYLSVTGDSRKGKAVSKQRIGHWIVDAILWHTKPKACRTSWKCKHTKEIVVDFQRAHPQHPPLTICSVVAFFSE